jgi:ATP-dependent DNA helicase 2 subunit 1
MDSDQQAQFDANDDDDDGKDKVRPPAETQPRRLGRCRRPPPPAAAVAARPTDHRPCHRRQFQRKKDLKIYLVDAHAAMQDPVRRRFAQPRFAQPRSARDGPRATLVTEPAFSCSQGGGAGDGDGDGAPGGGRSGFSHALKCVADTLAELIIASDTDQVGVCLYGTVKHKNSNNFPHIYVLHPLDVPDAAAIKKLRDMADAVDGSAADLGSLTSTTFKFDYALWVCQTMFAEVKHANTTKSIHILTNCPDPAEGDDRMLRDSVQKGKDLRTTNVEMFLYKMYGKKQFRTGIFFTQVMGIEHNEPDKDDHVMDASTFEQLANGVKSRRHVVRSTGTAPLYIFDEQFFVSVTVHTLVQKATKPSAIQLEARTNKPIKVESSTVSEETGEILLENQTGRRYDRYGGAQHIVFQSNELKEMKDFGPSAIRLIGFRNAEELKVHHNIKHSSFLQPDEEVVSGSTKVFTALVLKMAAKDVFALASIIPRRSAVPRLCALLPQLLVRGDSGEVVQSMGMHVVYLPYADDLRGPQQNPLQPVDRPVIETAKKLVSRLTVEKFDCRKYHNPSLQKHYKNLQTLALEEELDEGVDDDVRPSSDLLARHHKLMERFRDDALGDDWETVEQAAAPKKRKAGPVSAAALAEADLWKDYDWDEEIDAGSIGKLTMPVLKSYLRHFGLSATGKKQDLLERIQEHHAANANGSARSGGAGGGVGADTTGAAAMDVHGDADDIGGSRSQAHAAGGGGEIDEDGWEVAGNDLPALDPSSSSRPSQRQRTQDTTQSQQRQTQSQGARASVAGTQSQSPTQSQPSTTQRSTPGHGQSQSQSQRQFRTLSQTPTMGTAGTGDRTLDTAEPDDASGRPPKWEWRSSKGWNEYGSADNAALEDEYQNVSCHACPPAWFA